MTAPATARCSRAGCTFGAPGGVCAEGIADPVAAPCPNYLDLPAAPAVTSANHERQQLGVALPPGGSLDDQAAYSVTSAGPTRVVVVSGLADAGKTTLITSIYERLHSGPVGSLYFSRCASPHAFEEWCHDGRLNSERDRPDTPRTPHTSPGECRFLHLRLATSDHPGSLNGGTGSWLHRDLLVSDLQGEVFERIRDDSDAALRMPVLQRADHFVQLLDGKLLSDPARRQGAVADTKNILRSCLTAGTLTHRTIVHIVGTKWDLVTQSPNAAAAAQFFETTADSITASLQGHVADIRRHRTWARAPISGPTADWGAMELIADWFERSFQNAGPVTVPETPLQNEFDRYDRRVTPT